MSFVCYTFSMAAATAAGIALFVFFVTAAFVAAAVASVVLVVAVKAARVSLRAEVARYNRGPQPPLRA